MLELELPANEQHDSNGISCKGSFAGVPGSVWDFQSHHCRAAIPLTDLLEYRKQQPVKPLFIAPKTPASPSHISGTYTLELSKCSLFCCNLLIVPYLLSRTCNPPSPKSHSTLKTSIHHVSDESGVKHRTGDVHTSWLHIVSFTSDCHQQ